LGVDPGTIHMGVGLVDLADDEATHIASTTLSPPSKLALADRLAKIFDALDALMAEWLPDAVAIEQPFAGKNIRSALAVGQAQAVAMVVAARRGLPVSTYSPSQVKQAVTDHGGSSKEQVREMVQIVLQMEEPPGSSDAADALAVALCHVNASRANQLIILD